ncbi:MAG: TIGR04282 family arsenosugar biosynthesis glycosyltransferase [Blastocatellia bacterium]|nr:TIGR04282 family arsenosugar biosynthesis glycosyltransferase [Blastocatellia bacterium]
MTKVPGFADVKTRLRPLLSESQSAELAGCFLTDTITNLASVFEHRVIAFTPDDGRESIETVVGGDIYIPQGDGDLGQRLDAAIAEAFEMGFGPVLVIGTDSPTLPHEYLAQASGHLQSHEDGVAIGPTDDGGFYLIGVSRPREGIYDGVTWSSDKTCEQTVANIKNIGDVDLLVLPRWYDVDEPKDLERLIAEIDSDEAARDRAPTTSRWLTANQKTFVSELRIVKFFFFGMINSSLL